MTLANADKAARAVLTAGDSTGSREATALRSFLEIRAQRTLCAEMASADVAIRTRTRRTNILILIRLASAASDQKELPTVMGPPSTPRPTCMRERRIPAAVVSARVSWIDLAI